MRNKIQKIKIDMANEVIDAGRFDMQTSMAERKETLESLLQVRPPELKLPPLFSLECNVRSWNRCCMCASLCFNLPPPLLPSIMTRASTSKQAGVGRNARGALIPRSNLVASCRVAGWHVAGLHVVGLHHFTSA